MGYVEEVAERNKTKREQCAALAKGIAKALPGNWSWSMRDDLGHSATLADDKGHQFYINTEHAGPGRVHVSGRYDVRPGKQNEGFESWAISAIKSETGREFERPSISCATTKTPEQIAKDIARRFLPDFLALAAKVRLAIVKADEADASRAASAEALIAASGGRAEKRGNDGVHFYPGSTSREVGYYEATTSGDGTARIEFRSVPIEVLAEMLALYHAHVAKVNGWTEVEA
jgi:hypothetical protein